MKPIYSVLLLTLVLGVSVAAQQPATKPAAPAPAPAATHAADPGERAFKANCGRCHTAPEQISPRITRAVVMHMRVRANLSAADEKALIHYFAP